MEALLRRQARLISKTLHVDKVSNYTVIIKGRFDLLQGPTSCENIKLLIHADIYLDLKAGTDFVAACTFSTSQSINQSIKYEEND